MKLTDFSRILKIFGGNELSADEYSHLFNEVMLMTLSRATDSDSNVQPVEVETVREILKRVTGNDYPVADIRVAAASAIYEEAPMRKYLSSAGRKLKSADKSKVVLGLAEVLKSDTRISESEIAFFNEAADALNVTPSEIAGLIPG